MEEDSQDPHSSGRIHTVHPLRDLESNWTVDLSKQLEDYLLKICSGEISASEDAHFSVNFAEAALLLQGSIQVYSRKVEYLYNLVLHALEFISQTRPQDQAETTPVQLESTSSHAITKEDDDFWCSDDIPVEPKNCLEINPGKDASMEKFVKAPANLIVLEGDCLDSSGDGGELESYLLATSVLYRDFILLDPRDAAVVDEFLKDDKPNERQSGYKGSSLTSKARRIFQSPTRKSGGSSRKLSAKKCQETSPVRCSFEDIGPDHSVSNIPENGNYCSDMDEPGAFDDSDGDDDDPWRPLNPHEPGNLKVKPFKKVKVRERHGFIKQIRVSVEFPLAKSHGTICPDLIDIWEMQRRAYENQQEPQSPPFYEKLRQSLLDGGSKTHEAFFHHDNEDEDNGFCDGPSDFEQPDFDMPHDAPYMDEAADLQQEKHDDFTNYNDTGHEDPPVEASLEDLCRSHLDALLASIAESEKQTELATRVSTWKQRIENDLEEEDSHPPFDIHKYGKTVLDKLSEGDGDIMSFVDVASVHEKHDVARTFTALLQLVNDGKVELDRSNATAESFCYTAENPFRIRLISHEKEPKIPRFQPTKKRAKSGSGSKSGSSAPNCKFSVKLGNPGGLRCTPDGKRRRRSRLIEPVDLLSLE